MCDDVFVDVFATKYESFLIDNKPEYDVFEFNNLCSTADCLLAVVSESAIEFVSPVMLELKFLPYSLKYAFLGADESLPILITSDLSRDQEDILISLLRQNKEAVG